MPGSGERRRLGTEPTLRKRARDKAWVHMMKEDLWGQGGEGASSNRAEDGRALACLGWALNPKPRSFFWQERRSH